MTIRCGDLADTYIIENSVAGDELTDPPEVDEDEAYELEQEIDDLVSELERDPDRIQALEEARRKEARRANGNRLNAALRGIALTDMEITAKYGLPTGLGRRRKRRE